MNEKHFYTFLGVIFVVSSGVIYTLEKMNTYIYWQGQVASGDYPTTPDLSYFPQNFISFLFFIIGIILVIYAFNYKNKQK